MPQAKPRSSAGLSIALKNPVGFFTPGSKVVGDVMLKTLDDFAIGSVVVEMYGRVKVHFTQSHGQGESHWRGRAPLFSKQAILYEGYHTHKPGSFSWPFQLEIPSNPEVATFRESKHQWAEKEHFVSTNDYISAHTMPPTFKYRKWGFGHRFNAFVEYVMVATVKEAKGTSSVLLSTRKATLPLVVKSVAEPAAARHRLPLDIEFRLPPSIEQKPRVGLSPTSLHEETIQHTVKSSRLLLWNREATNSFERSPALSFSDSIRERTRSVFSPSSLPRFTFNITVSTPDSIQVLDEKGVPFTISAIPVNDSEKTTIPAKQYPDIRVESVSLSVKAKTYIRWKGMLSDRTTTTDSEIKLLDRYPINQELVMYHANLSAQSSREGTDGQAQDQTFIPNYSDSIDVLKLIGPIAVLCEHKVGRQTEKPLPPTFHTYIVSREYELSWRLELDIAGEKVKIDSNGGRVITVLDPKLEDLEAFVKTTDFIKGKQVEDVDDDEDSENDSQESESTRTAHTGEHADTKSRFRHLIRRTKSDEAAEETAAASGDVAISVNRPAFGYQPGEILPRYEPGPSDFGYRNEIDEEPPRYAKE